MRLLRHAALAFPALLPTSLMAEPALPTGATVVAGTAAVGTPAAGQMRIDQSSHRAVIDWQSFSIGAGGQVHFANGNGATLNRVLGGDPSSLMGRLSASGSLWLINPAGILVGPNGQVSTGGSFLASTRAIAPAEFMAGDLQLQGTSTGNVTNQGQIVAGGDVVLVGHMVDNRGQIRASGSASLTAADRILLREAGADGRIHIELADQGSGHVSTTGRIEAAAAELRAVGGNVYALAADTGGVIRATGSQMQGGRILLVGGEGVTVVGTLDASGPSGGQIDVTAPGIRLAGSAALSARGDAGDGGTIRIGGERQGAPGLAQAQRLLVDAGATIDAGSDRGRGGTVILWSTQWTRFEGLIQANGPAGGGFVETSSKGALGIEWGEVQVGNGQWLLDPRDVIIGAGGFNPGGPYPDPFEINPPNAAGAYVVSRSALQNALNAGSDVIVTTVQPGQADAGNITVSASVSWAGNGSLTLLADNDIVVNAAMTSSGAGSLLLDAANLVELNADVVASGSGNLHFIGRGEGVAFVGAGGGIWQTAGGNFTVQAPSLAGDILMGRSGFSGDLLLQSGSGALTLQAGRSIHIGRPLATAGLVTVGGLGDTGPVTLLAGQAIHLLASPEPGADARLLAGGTLSLTAPTVELASTAQSQALLQARGEYLWVHAATANWHGTLDSSAATHLSGGLHSFTISPLLTLAEGNSFSLAADAQIQSSAAINITTSGNGSIRFLGPVQGTLLFARAGNEVEVGAPISMAGEGSSLILQAGVRLINTAGQSLSAPNGRWLSYSVSPYDDIGWQDLNPDQFNLYGRGFGFTPPVSSPGTGNRRIYSFTPILTLAGADAAKTYGQAGPVLGYNLLGLVPGDSETIATTGIVTVSSAGTAVDADAGTYAVTATGLTPSGQGYALQLADGTLTVNPAPLAIVANPASKVYGAADPTFTYSASGFVLGQSAATILSGQLSRMPGEGVAGSPYAITLGSLAANSNYSINFTSADFSILPAALSVVADPQQKIYGAGDPALTFTASGFQLGDTVASLSGSLARETGESVGDYAITQGSLANPNYTIAFTGATFRIDPALLIVSALAQTREYGLADPALTFTASGFQFADDASVLSGQLVRTPGEAVGLYQILQGTLAAENYVISFNGADFTITPAPLSIVADTLTKLYGAPDPALTFTASGFRLTDTAATVLTGALARTPGETVAGGPYAITQGTLAANSNYVIDFVSAPFTISQRLLAVSLIGSVSRSYDATVTATLTPLNLQLAGVLPGDVVDIAAGFARYDTPDVGTGKLVTAEGLQLTGADAGNYTVAGSSSAAIGTITRAPLLARALDASRPFGTPNPPFQLELTGLFGTDTAQSIGLTGVTEATQGSAPGLYAIDVAGNPLNYDVTRISGLLSVLALPMGLGAFGPEPVEVPGLGGLTQMGVAVGVTAIWDTLDPVAAATAAGNSVAEAKRFTISREPAPPAPPTLIRPGGASGFDALTRPN